MVLQTCQLKLDTNAKGWHKTISKVLKTIEGEFIPIYKLNLCSVLVVASPNLFTLNDQLHIQEHLTALICKMEA